MGHDPEVLSMITKLVDEEHHLRSRSPDVGSQADRTARLASIEIELDQCWDLLRQRQALRDAGDDPREARVRPAEQVENYWG